MRRGSARAFICPASLAMPASLLRTIGCPWKPCYGSHGSMRPGAICRHGLGTGTRCPATSGAGRKRVRSTGSLLRSPVIPMSNAPWWTAPSRVCLSTRWAPKGECWSGDRTFARRPDHKVVVLVGALGNLVRFVFLPGQRYDCADGAPLVDVSPLMPRSPTRASTPTRCERNSTGTVIPPKTNRKAVIHCNLAMFRRGARGQPAPHALTPFRPADASVSG